jgi:hypothetical protein
MVPFLACENSAKKKISDLVSMYKQKGFKVKILTASKTGKAKSALKKGENPADFVKYQYSIELEKKGKKKKVILRIFTEKEVERNYYNLKSAVSKAPNSYFVIRNNNMILTMFSFDIEKEREILTEIAEIFKAYKK